MSATATRCRIYIHCSRPGKVIGKGGAEIEQLRRLTVGQDDWQASSPLHRRGPDTVDTNAQLVAENIAGQLESRIGFRRAMKNAIGRAMRMGAQGHQGHVCPAVWAAPRSPAASATTRAPSPCRPSGADIDYGFAEAATTYGRIGVKVWIYKGEVLSQTLRTTPRTMDTAVQARETAAATASGRPPAVATAGTVRAATTAMTVRAAASTATTARAAITADPGPPARLRALRPRKEAATDADAQESQIPQGAARPHEGQSLPRQCCQLR